MCRHRIEYRGILILPRSVPAYTWYAIHQSGANKALMKRFVVQSKTFLWGWEELTNGEDILCLRESNWKKLHWKIYVLYCSILNIQAMLGLLIVQFLKYERWRYCVCLRESNWKKLTSVCPTVFFSNLFSLSLKKKETGVSRIPNWGPPVKRSPNTIVLWWFEGFQGGILNWVHRIAERRHSLGQLYDWSWRFSQSGK